MKVPQYLFAVNLHDRRPFSISTSKISHVTENRNWFWVKVKRNQLTYPPSVEYKNTGKQKMTRVIKDCQIVNTVALRKKTNPPERCWRPHGTKLNFWPSKIRAHDHRVNSPLPHRLSDRTIRKQIVGIASRRFIHTNTSCECNTYLLSLPKLTANRWI